MFALVQYSMLRNAVWIAAATIVRRTSVCLSLVAQGTEGRLCHLSESLYVGSRFLRLTQQTVGSVGIPSSDTYQHDVDCD